GQKLTPTAVQAAAEALGLGPLIRTPERLRGDALEQVLATPCDAIVVVAYGLLLPKALVEARTCLNIHPSPLPRWRGAAPIQHTLLAGDTTTEVCIMKLDAGMDTGPVYHREPFTIPPSMNAGDLHDVCATLGAQHLLPVLANLATLTPISQTEDGACLAPKITAEMRPLNPSQPAQTLHNQVRALAPSPAATLTLGGEVCKVLQTNVLPPASYPLPPGTLTATETSLNLSCANSLLSIQIIQRPNRKPQPIAEALRGWEIHKDTTE
ncbi:MAG: methionyl-tRNA formyltransferase, partial [Alphaproteobacteria bacterium]